MVQVKGGKDIALVASTYKDFLAHGYRVFLYAPHYVKAVSYTHLDVYKRQT